MDKIRTFTVLGILIHKHGIHFHYFNFSCLLMPLSNILSISRYRSSMHFSKYNMPTCFIFVDATIKDILISLFNCVVLVYRNKKYIASFAYLLLILCLY